MGKGHFVKNYPMNGHKLLRQHSKHKLSISVKTTLVGTRFSTWRNLRAIKQKPLEIKSPGRARLWARLPQVPLLTGAVRPGSPCSGQKRIRRHHCIFSSRLQLGRDRATVAFGSHPKPCPLQPLQPLLESQDQLYMSGHFLLVRCSPSGRNLSPRAPKLSNLET